MASKKTVTTGAIVRRPMNPGQALEDLKKGCPRSVQQQRIEAVLVRGTGAQVSEMVRSSFKVAGFPRLSEHQLDLSIDIITSARGSAAEAVRTLAVLPSERRYWLARMLLHRRVWQLGARFLNDPWFAEQYQYIRMTEEETNKMVNHFGAEKVAAFLRPATATPHASQSGTRPSMN